MIRALLPPLPLPLPLPTPGTRQLCYLVLSAAPPLSCSTQVPYKPLQCSMSACVGWVVGRMECCLLRWCTSVLVFEVWMWEVVGRVQAQEAGVRSRRREGVHAQVGKCAENDVRRMKAGERAGVLLGAVPQMCGRQRQWGKLK